MNKTFKAIVDGMLNHPTEDEVAVVDFVAFRAALFKLHELVVEESTKAYIAGYEAGNYDGSIEENRIEERSRLFVTNLAGK